MKKLNNKGFTLVELIAVMAIMLILLGLAIGTYTAMILDSQKSAFVAEAMVQVKGVRAFIESEDIDIEDENTVYYFHYLLGVDQSVSPFGEWEDCYVAVTYDAASDKNTYYWSGLDSEKWGIKLIKEASDLNKDDVTRKEMEKVNVGYSINSRENVVIYTATEDGYEEEAHEAFYNVESITEIKVLNVYPNASYANYLKNWMNTYGKNIIKVTPVSIENFNANPNGYLGDSANWNYDVIVFGFADCNSNKDLTATAASVVNSFLNDGNSAIFGHDTITEGCGNHVNFITLKDHVALDMTTPDTSVQGTKITIKKKGIFTQHPYDIGDVGDDLTIPNTHVYGQIAKGEVWLTFSGQTDPYRSIYLSTRGHNAFIQTGHRDGEATEDEQKIIANIIFYTKAKQLGL